MFNGKVPTKKIRPIFSIIIAAYNAEKYIKKCLDSLLDQQLLDYEIIVVNDGSTDRTGDICDHYAKDNFKINIIHQSNTGVSGARNRGLDNAVGQYILFVDADDTINKVLHHIEKVFYDTKCEVVALSGVMYTTKGKKQIKVGGTVNRLFTPKEYIINARSNNEYIEINNLYSYKRSFLEENNLRYMVGVIHEDMEFIPRALLSATKIYVSDIQFYNYYRRVESITLQKNQKKNASDIIKIIIGLKKEFKDIKDEELKFWLDDLLISYYLSAIYRGDLSMITDKKILESFSVKGMRMRSENRKNLDLILYHPYKYEIPRNIRKLKKRLKIIINTLFRRSKCLSMKLL